VLAVAGLGFAAANEPSKAATLVDEEAVAAQQRALDSLPELGPDTPTRSAVDPSLPARVLVVGDSQAWAIGSRLGELWGAANGVNIVPSPGVGCGIGELTPIIYLGVEYQNGRDGCREWREALPAILAKLQPQMVMVIGGFGDVADHQLPGSDEWQHIGEPGYDTWLSDQMRQFVDEMTAKGANVLWFSMPHVKPPRAAGTDPFAEEDPARNGPTAPEVLARVPAATPVFAKPVFGLADVPDIAAAIAASGRRTVVIAGMETDVCVAQSAIGLLDAGYRVAVVSDATFAPGEMHEHGITRVRDAGAVIVHAKGVYYEWVWTLAEARRFEESHPDLADPPGFSL